MIEFEPQPKSPLIASHTLPRAGTVTEDASWIEFLNRCEELAPNIGEKNRRPPCRKYLQKKRLVIFVVRCHWKVVDRKNGEIIAWGKEKDYTNARAAAKKVRDEHVKQRCPNGNIL